MSNQHKDASLGGNSGCESYDSENSCPLCNQAGALLALEQAAAHVRRLEPFVEDAHDFNKIFKSLWHRVDRFTFKRGGGK